MMQELKYVMMAKEVYIPIITAEISQHVRLVSLSSLLNEAKRSRAERRY
jgi:hypothetical protein